MNSANECRALFFRVLPETLSPDLAELGVAADSEFPFPPSLYRLLSSLLGTLFYCVPPFFTLGCLLWADD